MILFLGSGVSLPTGLPRVGELTEAIMWQHWHLNTDQLFYSGKAEAWSMADPTETVQCFLRYLKGIA
ncbi:MAG: hypothetical protein U0984_14160, partial [Prosthecobacter sp.]|nr:hypothetical protein [Prosthecobacter sp.]